MFLSYVRSPVYLLQSLILYLGQSPRSISLARLNHYLIYLLQITNSFCFSLFLNPLISAFLEALLDSFSRQAILIFSFISVKILNTWFYILCLIIPISELFAAQTLLPVISVTLSQDTLLLCMLLIFHYEFMFLKALYVRMWGWDTVGFVHEASMVYVGFSTVHSSCKDSWVLDCWLCFFSLNNSLRHGFAGGSDGKESAHNVGEVGSIPGWIRSPGEGHGSPLQYTWLENSADKGVWQTTVHRVAKSQTQLCYFHLYTTTF